MNAVTLPSTVQWVTGDLGVFVVEGDRKYAARWAEACEWCKAYEHATECTCERVAPEAWAQYDGQVGYVTWRPKGHQGFDAARVTIEVVPVVHEDNNRYLDPPFLEVAPPDKCVYWMPDVRTQVAICTFDPLPRPGRDFVVVVRKVAP